MACDEVWLAVTVCVSIFEVMSSVVYSSLFEHVGCFDDHAVTATDETTFVRVLVVWRTDAPRECGVPDAEVLWVASLVGWVVGSGAWAYGN